MKIFFVIIFLFVCFKTRFLCIALNVLELALLTSLFLNSEICQPLLPEAVIQSMHHHCIVDFHTFKPVLIFLVTLELKIHNIFLY